MGSADHSFPYRISEHRPLTEQERKLLHFLVAQCAPDRLTEIESLEVRGRCGCGKCPTIMFLDDSREKKDAQDIVADFYGGDDTHGRVGVILWEADGKLSELEAWSIDGRDVFDWPQLDSLRVAQPNERK